MSRMEKQNLLEKGVMLGLVLGALFMTHGVVSAEIVYDNFYREIEFDDVGLEAGQIFGSEAVRVESLTVYGDGRINTSNRYYPIGVDVDGIQADINIDKLDLVLDYGTAIKKGTHMLGNVNINKDGGNDVIIIGDIIGPDYSANESNIGDLYINLDTPNSYFTGSTAGRTGTLSLSNGATWNVRISEKTAWGGITPPKFSIEHLIVNAGGNVNLRHNDNTTLNNNNSDCPHSTMMEIYNFEGKDGNFLFDTNFADPLGDGGDMLFIDNSVAGSGGIIQIYDQSLVSGEKVDPTQKKAMIVDESGLTTWKAKSLDTGGLWTITPTLYKSVEKWAGEEASVWYIGVEDPSQTPIVKPNPTTETTLGAFDSGYSLWHMAMTDDSLRKRLGDLRYEGADDAGVWARVKAGKLSGSGYDNSYQTSQIGYDKKVGNTAYGFAVDYTKAKAGYVSGNGDGSMSVLSLYATSYHPSGAYSDVVLKGGKLRNDVSAFGEYNDALDYSAWAYSLGYEVGKTLENKNTGWFVEPQAQLVYGYMKGGDYTTNKGVSVDKEAINSLIGRVGFTAGRKINKESDYYLKANLYREFAGNSDMNLTAKNSFGDTEHMLNEDRNKDTWAEIGLGTNVKLSKGTYFYGDVLKTFGANINKKWQVNAGMRWAF